MNNTKKTISLNTIDNYCFIEVKKDEIIKVINPYSDDKDNNSNMAGVIFINSKRINIPNISTEENNIIETIKCVNEGHVHIYIDIEENKNDFNFELEIGKESGEKRNIIIEYSYNKNEIANSNKSLGLNTDIASFMLLRTNPKLTGNIKLVLDSKDNMYLDTFEINSILSNYKYKHKQISPDSNYANDVRNIFSSIPNNKLFEVSEDNYNLFSTKNKLSEQYVDTYNYGAKTNTNRLYSENFALLAPLYVNNTLPDFFVVFKLDGPIEQNKFDNNTDNFKNILKKGKVIKTYDMRKDTAIGTYLRKLVKENEKINGSVFISMDNYIQNEWNGISIQRGVMTSVKESPFLFSQLKNQVDYDRFVTNGFERNGILSSKIINLEFMFDDELDNLNEDFKINRYFGLYI